LESVAGAVLAGAAAFAATNVDDLFLLVAWFAAGRTRARDIVAGQYLGIGALFAVSAAASAVSLVVPEDWLRWLGLLPLLLGVRLLASSRKENEKESQIPGLGAVTAVTVANGADNIAVYVPLFANSSAQAIALMGAVFAVLLWLWCLAARWLVHHPAAGAPLRRYGPPLVPWVLVALGVWILLGF
jgi:cadmium resistance protein CadD (predicted permease)